MILGSVSRYVAVHAACPVIVVRQETSAVHREIAVGIRETEDGTAALAEMYKQAQRLTKPKHAEWYDTVAKGAFAEAQDSLKQIVDLTAGKLEHLKEAQNHFIAPAPYNTVGYCGTLNRYFDPATLLPEGVSV